MRLLLLTSVDRYSGVAPISKIVRNTLRAHTTTMRNSVAADVGVVVAVFVGEKADYERGLKLHSIGKIHAVASCCRRSNRLKSWKLKVYFNIS